MFFQDDVLGLGRRTFIDAVSSDEGLVDVAELAESMRTYLVTVSVKLEGKSSVLSTRWRVSDGSPIRFSAGR